MITLKFKYTTDTESSNIIREYRKQYSSVLRYAYNRRKENVSEKDCEMVQGANLLLDRLSLGYDKVEVDFSDVDNGKPIYRYHLIEHNEDGGTYTNGNETFWLCNVTHDVFDEHPKMLYINKVMCK